jgi:hypothetical protein
MLKKTLVLAGLFLVLVPIVAAQKETGQETIECRVMEVFVAEQIGVTAVVFHQRDKADGPRLGELLLAHSGEGVEFETRDARRHPAALGRMKSCFGRGLLLFASGEAKLAEKEEFVLRFPRKN